jgi:hypothetical protein
MGFVEQMKWWHWTLISLVLGPLLGYLNSGVSDTSIDHSSVSTVVFEADLLSQPWVDPNNPANRRAWMSDIVVHPVQDINVGGSVVKCQLVSFQQYTAPTAAHPSGETSTNYLFAPFPYEPTPRNGPNARMMTYPAASLYYGKVGDTLSSLALKFYKKDTVAGERAILGANATLRQAQVSSLKIRPYRAYWIPWDPAAQHNINDFLIAADQVVRQQQGANAIPIRFHYYWWENSRYVMQIWIIGTFVLVGVIWPLLLHVMVKGGLGKMTPEEYSLRSYRPQPQEPAKAPVPVAAGEMQKLRDLEEASAASVKGMAMTAAAPAAEPEVQVAPPQVQKLSGGPAEPAVVSQQQPEEAPEYMGEYYPVVKPHTHVEEKK